jgi:hypothetical protein
MSTFPRRTLAERGYYMTEADMELREDVALAKCIRLKRVLASTRREAIKTAEEMAGLAEQLRKGEWYKFSPESYGWLKPEGLQKCLHDIQLAENELAEANDAARVLGVTLPE